MCYYEKMQEISHPEIKKEPREYFKKDCHLQNHYLKQFLIGMSGTSLDEAQADFHPDTHNQSRLRKAYKHLLKSVII